MDRTYPERPIVGVGAVVLDGDRVLLVKRAHEPLKGEWSLPGGVVDVGETLKTAVAREVFEETGLQVEVGPLVEVVDRITRDDGGGVAYHYVVVDYLCRVLGGCLMCASDAEAAEWASIADLARLRVASAAIDVIRKAASCSWPPDEVHGYAK